MKLKVLLLTVLNFAILSQGMAAESNMIFHLSNAYVGRTLSIQDGILRTVKIENKRLKKSWEPTEAAEFRVRVSKGTQFLEGDEILSSRDFKCTGQKSYVLQEGGKGLEFTLENKTRPMKVVVRYELKTDEFYMRKWLEIESGTPITLEYIEVESIPAADASQPYTCREIYARGTWRPGLGQPLYTTQTSTFWGMEFPAAVNSVEAKVLQCAYYWGREVKAGEKYKTYASVCGVGDDPAYVFEAFLEYIDKTRAHEARLQVQYNTWFDMGGGVTKDSFKTSIETIHDQLVQKRGCPALNAYVIDAGWSRKTDVLKQAYPVNNKFDSDFTTSRQAVKAAESSLGLWLSPGCFFGSQPMVSEYRAAGYEALSLSMSMCGPKYMDLWEKRVLELTKLGISYFKFDGLFGHLHVRDFELQGRGCPGMPQLETNFSCNDERLNEDKYNELKYYYLTAGSERLISAFTKIREINPEIYIAITNGAWLSPWWLQHVDTVWLINAGDAATGATRREELVYRDGIYNSIYRVEKTQFPMNSLFNHEPKKNKAGETAKEFRDYLWMNMSRGTGFIELYIRPRVLTESDWDILSEGILWVHEIFPCFKRARMHGGAPQKGEVYGFSGWDGVKIGYVSIHNPSDVAQDYNVHLDRALGMLPGDTNTYKVKEVVGGGKNDLATEYKFGDSLTLKMEPGEIRVIQFEVSGT
ncbi:MAG: hypothetical protein Q4C96_03265 [Planctomycetia bacterium]|nr:hypothetical protein [Planctomycetia bacterium]